MTNEERLINAFDLIDWLDNFDRENTLRILRGKKAKLLNSHAIRNMIVTVPRVDAVAVVHGRWIMKQEPITWCEDDVEVFWECSICQCRNFGESPYCPLCGAKMDGGN